MTRWLLVFAGMTSACWTTELPELEANILPFSPKGAEAPEGWVVQAWPQGDQTCPGGDAARFWLVYPQDGVGPLPMAVVFHDDVADIAASGDPENSVLRDTSALTAEHATRSVFRLLGMGTEDGTGALVAALARSGHMIVLPSNCWGDLYANSIDDRTNDQAEEGFARRGFDAAEFGWRMVSDDAWATINRVALPVTPDYENPVAIGIGQGGRAIGELLNDELVMQTVVLNGPLDDVGPIYDNPDSFPELSAVLDRVFADELDANRASFGNVPELPGRTAYLYSRLDPELPAMTHDAALSRLAGVDSAWVLETGSTTHAPLADDAELAARVITWIGE